MFRRSRRVPLEEDPYVAPVEAMLAAAGSRASDTASGQGNGIVTYALSICACCSTWEAPKWLIYDLPEGGIAWRRIPDEVETLSSVATRYSAGGHTDPESVLLWLSGDAPDPWYAGSGWGDGVVLDELRMRIRSQ